MEKGLVIKEEIHDQFNGLSEEYQIDVVFWCIRKGIVKVNVRTATEEEKAKVELTGEINQQALEQALKELKQSGEI